MYPSDYGYATSGGSTTDRGTCLNENLYGWLVSEMSDCKNNDWLYKKGVNQWTITPCATTIGAYNVFNLYKNGYIEMRYASYNSSLVPTIYLKSEIKIESGNGAMDSPYQLVI